METDLISPGRIGPELTRIWDLLRQANQMRASLFNLIFFTVDPHRVDYLRGVVNRVIEKFPSRVIHISLSPSGKLEAKVSVMPVGDPKSSIACDLIELFIPPNDTEKLPFLILPHLLTDLPIYLVWIDDPVEHPQLLKQMERITTRIIFDSESAASCCHFAQELLRLRDEDHCDIADLNWARIENWRSVFSNLFHKQKTLPRFRSLNITYNSLETPSFSHPLLPSLYFQAWLSSQLGWKFQKIEREHSDLHLHYEQQKNSLAVKLIADRQPSIHPGGILGIEIDTEDDEHFTISRDPLLPACISTIRSTSKLCELPSRFFFPKGELGQSLVKEISHKGTSSHFLNSLKQIAHYDPIFFMG